MEWFRIQSLKHGVVDVESDNWLSALGTGLGRMGVVQDLSRIACETLPNGHILVRDARTGAGYVVVAMGSEAFPEEQTSEQDLQPIPEEAIQISVGVEEYAADIRNAPDGGEAVRRALASLQAVAPSESGAVLRRHSDGWLGFEGAFGPSAERLAGLVIPPGTGVAGFTVQHGIGVSLKDAYTDARFFRQIDGFTGYTTRSLVAMPLSFDGQLYGCVELINSPRQGGFTREELAEAELLAKALSIRLSREPVPTPPSAAGR